MTRANINYIYQKRGHSPKTLYYYQNGDQYPRGMREYYHVLDFTNGDWSQKSFTKWLSENYKETEAVAYNNPNSAITVVSNYNPTDRPAKPTKRATACIYYDLAGYITDYSYIFDSTDKKILVYEWQDKIFEGNPSEFETWLKMQK